MWPEEAPGTNHWYAQSWAFQPGGQYEIGGDVVVLDNGDIWFANAHYSGAYDPYMYGFTLFSKISPEGVVRYSGEGWIWPTWWEYNSDHGTYLEFGPRSILGYNDTDMAKTDVTGFLDRKLITDGTNIYFAQATGDSGNTANCKVYKFDPSTGKIEWIAGGFTPSVVFGWSAGQRLPDGFNGRDGLIRNWVSPFVYGKYLYFWDKVWSQGSTYEGYLVLRRINLENGNFTLETMEHWLTQSLDLDSINPSTGLQNFNNLDTLVTGDKDCPIGIYEDHLYMLSEYYDAVIRRINLAKIETEQFDKILFMGETNPNGWDETGPLNPSEMLNPAIGVRGNLDFQGFFSNYFSHGTMTQDGHFLTTRSMGFSVEVGFGVVHSQVVAFDIKELEVLSTDGVVIHDPWNPIFDVVVNGTTFDELSVTRLSYPNFMKAGWYMRTGAKPLVTNMPHGMDCNPNSPYPNTAFMPFEMRDYDTTSNGSPTLIVALNKGGPMVEFQVNLSFEGRSLKGYSASQFLAPPSAPEQIVLS